MYAILTIYFTVNSFLGTSWYLLFYQIISRIMLRCSGVVYIYKYYIHILFTNVVLSVVLTTQE